MYHDIDITNICIFDILYILYIILYIVYMPFYRSCNYLRYFTAGRKIAY